MSDALKNKTKSGFLWSFIERFSVQGIQFLIMIFMARLLMPEDYGIIGMLAIFLAIAQSLVDSGFSQALIRKQNRTEVDNSTVFYFNIVVALFLYGICFLVAPFVAEFYKIPVLCPVMRVISISFVINSLVVVQRALFTSAVNFKTQAKASLVAVVISGSAGITLAYKGFGVWSLVCQQLANLSINAILLWFMSNWRPRFVYSWQSFKELFSFGSKLLLSGLLDTTYTNIRPLIIGKVFSAADLGFYTRAQHFAQFPSSNVTSILQRVTYPVLCQIDDEERLASVYRKFLRSSAFVIFPLMMGLAALSKPFIEVVIGAKWAFSAELLIIICFSLMWYPIHAINLNLLQVKGRSDLFLKLEIIKKIIGIVMLVVTVPLGLKAMCYGAILTSYISLAVNTYYTGKLIKVGFFMQMKDLLPILILSFAMFGGLLYVDDVIPNIYVSLFGGTAIGCVFYLFCSKIFRFRAFSDILSFLKKK